MLETNHSNSSQIVLVDARPRVNAMANTAMGAGVEDKKRYQMVKIKFLGIDNIHAMRKSFHALFEICQSKAGQSDVNWFSSLESTKWFDYIQLILHSAIRIIKLVHFQSTSVTIHCSDGWDRTPQLSSLSMIMLDPYSRTLGGFIRLLELEWLAFGHKFCDRLGHIFGSKESEVSPVFLQFMDCVYQIMVQFPKEFEFNQSLLLCILYHASSTQFGTFLFNTPKERKEAQVQTTTVSLWTYVLTERDIFLNPLYKFGKSKTKESIIIPKTDTKHLTFWKEFYFGSCARDSFCQTWNYLNEIRKLKDSTDTNHKHTSPRRPERQPPPSPSDFLDRKREPHSPDLGPSNLRQGQLLTQHPSLRASKKNASPDAHAHHRSGFVTRSVGSTTRITQDEIAPAGEKYNLLGDDSDDFCRDSKSFSRSVPQSLHLRRSRL